MIHAETQFHLSGMIFLFLHLPPDQLVALANVAGVVGLLPAFGALMILNVPPGLV